ncbi:MAG: SIS domain-containing protein [Candidatus Thorarchaeota archaeon]|nr:MAG: SIS domain-containing protein [Candidatus Thorarchaeota archaeon]
MRYDCLNALAESDIEKIIGILQHIDFARIISIAQRIAEALEKGAKVMLCGNGGSASQAQHLAAELVCRFKFERRAFDARALTTDTSILTAQANDSGFDTVFERQVEACGLRGDILIGLSTSGNSQNIINAIRMAKQMGLYTIAFTGEDRESSIAAIADEVLYVESPDTPRIQEAHLVIGHIVCEIVELLLTSLREREL